MAQKRTAVERPSPARDRATDRQGVAMAVTHPLARHRPRLLRALLLVVLLVASRTAPATPPDPGAVTRGIAILASDIGATYSVDALADLVRWGEFSPVVIDWAWITAHWDRTNFAEVNRLITLLQARHVEVAAMYRPRFLDHPTVPIQVKPDGQPATAHGQYICFSSPEARRWGRSWGERILAQFPTIDEVIIYNPLDQCACPNCVAARRAGPHAAVWAFLAEARAAWRARKPTAKLGVVYVNDPQFWQRGAEVLDVARPFLFISDSTDMGADIAGVDKLRGRLKGKLRSCLAKITWGPTDKVSPQKLAQFDRLAARHGLPYFLWTFDTPFLSQLYDRRAVIQALGLADSGVEEPLARLRAAAAAASAPAGGGAQPGSGLYTDEELRATSIDSLFRAISLPSPGYNQYAGLNGLKRKAQISDAATAGAIVAQAVRNLQSQGPETSTLRMQSAMLLGELDDPQVVPALAQALLNDPAAGVRIGAAGALGRFDDQRARAALMEAAAREYMPAVRQAIDQVLRDREQRRAQPEVCLADAAVLPPSPVRVAVAQLPWPFPGDFAAQSIFNNYQQPAGYYFHGGLDFIQGAGTPVTAVASGYVSAIFTNYPEWGNTHYCLLVAEQPNGAQGWCYTHLDPATYTCKLGDRVTQGQELGRVVKFAVAGNPGTDHLHLNHVRITRGADGRIVTTSLADPLLFFAVTDSTPPLFQGDLHFVRDATVDEFPIGDDGWPTVRGKADVIAAIADGAGGFFCDWGVPVVTFSIVGDAAHALHKLAFDGRGELPEATSCTPLILPREQATRWIPDTSAVPRFHCLRVTKSDGDGVVEPTDAAQSWDTAARDARGNRRWPDGIYTVTVYAWDLAGNRSAASAQVRVANE